MHDQQVLIDMALAMLRLVVLSSLPVVLVAAFVGLLVGVAQAVTQLQDQSVSYAVKFLAVAAVLALSMHWIGKSLAAFMRELFTAIVNVP